ncbi:DNA cytosine methyltransferase [Thalassovita sp.]|uniref:DNA cytosine methyltransferase n=1 Tax=Thalassovita sp. TaxID=1979401 RepID=UPI003B5B7CE1
MNPNSLAVQGHHGDVAGTVTAKWAKGLGGPAGDETQNMVAFDCKGTEVQHDTVAPPLRAMGHAGSHTNGGGHAAVAIQERAVSENPDAGPDGKGVRDDDTAFTLEARTQPQAVAFKPSHYTRGKDGAPSQVFPPLTADADKGDQDPVIAFDLRGREGGALPEGPHDTANLRAASGGSSRSYVQAGPIVRRLTPVECARLQGFEDNHCQITYRGRPAADGPQYKAYGNSMAVPVVAWILDRVQAAVAAGDKN